MKRRCHLKQNWLRITVLSCLFILLFSTHSVGQVNYLRLFNSGLNFGWLRMGTELGMFKNSWSMYAYGGTLEYNNAYNPPRNFQMPRTTVGGAQGAISYINNQVNPFRGASSVFMGAANLAYAHIYAQYGRCPSCMKRAMLAAGRSFFGAGRAMNNQVLMNVGSEIENTAARINPTRMTMPQVQSYTGYLAQKMTEIQRVL